MTAAQFESWLHQVVERELETDANIAVFSIDSFENAGILTHDRGLVVDIPGVAEFQLTVVRSGRSGSLDLDDDVDETL